MAVSSGEAGGAPPSYAIISNIFPTGRRGGALAPFSLGPPIGQALGVAIGASIAAAYGWREAFVVLGAVGFFAAVTVGDCIREPRRGGLDPAPATPLQTPTAGSLDDFAQTIRMFFSNPALLLVALASGATQIITYGAGHLGAHSVLSNRGAVGISGY